MYLYVSYSGGTYQHATNEAALSITRDATRDEAGRITGFIERWTIQGELQGANASALTTSMGTLATVYSSTITGIALYQDGGTITDHVMLAADTVTGIQVVNPPHYPDGTRDQYVLRRNYVIVLEAEYATATTNIISFTESIRRIGNGGPRIVAIPTLNGDVRFQQTLAATPVKIVQSGSAVGRFATPTPPAPLLPDMMLNEDEEAGETSPKPRGNLDEGFPIEWSYTFLLSAKVNLRPHRWPRR